MAFCVGGTIWVLLSLQHSSSHYHDHTSLPVSSSNNSVQKSSFNLRTSASSKNWHKHLAIERIFEPLRDQCDRLVWDNATIFKSINSRHRYDEQFFLLLRATIKEWNLIHDPLPRELINNGSIKKLALPFLAEKLRSQGTKKSKSNCVVICHQ
jgi:hypothetical protein